MDHRLTLQDYAEILAKQAEINEAHEREEEAKFAFFCGEQWDAKIDPFVRGKSLQSHGSTLVPIGLTRFDPSTKTRVPVTQEWVDEVVAEIVRLNVELGSRFDISQATPNAVTIAAMKELEVDRIWEAVMAASAV